MLPTSYRIGICVQYADGLYTLAGIEFKKNRDVVVWMPAGIGHQLSDGTKHDPHATYHADGTYHLATYANARRLPYDLRHPMERQRQALDSGFSGSENLTVWGFGREDAKPRKHNCSGFDECVTLDFYTIEPIRVETFVDDLGEYTRPVGASSAVFEVDLIEPGRYDLRHKLVPNPENLLVEKLI